MNNYLLQILKETKTIIIPGLGALTVTNEATGEMMFMSFLKHDDGNLAKYISEKEGMDINDAKNLIAKYVREIQAEVDKGDKYSMYQFGSFSKVDGEIVFEQWNQGSEQETAAETPSAPEETKAEEKVEPIVPAAEITPEPKVEEIILNEPTTLVEEAVTTIETPSTEPEPIVEQNSKTELGIVSSVTVETPSDPALEEQNPENEKIGKSESSPKTEIEIASIVAAETTPTVETSSNSAKAESKTQETIPAEKTPVMDTKVVVTQVPPIAEKKSTAADNKKPVGKSPKEQLKAADASKTTKKKKTGVFAYILWGFVVLILGAGTYVAVQFDTLKKDFPILAKLTGEEIEEKKDTLATLGEEDPIANPDSMPEAEELPQDAAAVEPIETESAPIETPAPKKTEPVKKPEPVKKTAPKPAKPTPVAKPAPKPVVSTQPTTTYKPKPKPANFPAPNLTKPYHIIAGSFSSRTNALNFATKLKKMGLTNLSVGEKGGLYKVSINGYSTEDEAKAALPSVSGIAPGAWVFNWN
jgi:hypothetical protein